MLRRYNFIFC